MRSEPVHIREISLDSGIPPKWSHLGEKKFVHINMHNLGSAIEFSFLRMYIFCFGILFKFNFNMAAINTTMITAK